MLLLVMLALAARASPCPTAPGGAAKRTAVNHYFFDFAVRLCWAVVIDCSHPERPATVIPVSLPPVALQAPEKHNLVGFETAQMGSGGQREAGSALSRLPLVIAGSTVEVWKEGPVGIQLSGVAMQSAPLGAGLLVRPAGWDTPLRGIARGAHSVELVEDGKGWREP